MKKIKACAHEKFEAEVKVGRLTNEQGEVQSYCADVRVTCAECHVPFEFLGLPAGLIASGAAVSADGEEARLYIKPSEWHAEKLRRAN